MRQLSDPLQFLVVAVAGWINQQQRDVIDYFQEENRVLREHLAPQRLRFTDAQRRRLAAKAKTLGRTALAGTRRSSHLIRYSAGIDDSSIRNTTAAAGAGPDARASSTRSGS